MSDKFPYKDLSMPDLVRVVADAEEELGNLTKQYEAACEKPKLTIEKVQQEVERRKKALDTVLQQGKILGKVVTKGHCSFVKAWIGECGCKEVLENGQCAEHQKKCGCGKLAIHECAHAGQFVCGRPLCETCRCKH